MPKVYVLNRHGRPLMPCTPAKAVIFWMRARQK